MRLVAFPMKLVWTPRRSSTPLRIRSTLEHQERNGEKRMSTLYYKKRNMHKMLEKRIKFVLHKLNTEYDEMVVYEKHALLDEIANTSVFIRDIEKDINHMEQKQTERFASTDASENNIDL